MKHNVILAFACLGQALYAQEKQPWEVDRLCGRLQHVQKIPDHKIPNTFSEKRKPLQRVFLRLYEKPEGAACSDGVNAIETIETGKGGHFEFRTEKAGNFCLNTNWSGKEYALSIVYKPAKNSTTVCSQQGIALDDEGNADWWVTITVD